MFNGKDVFAYNSFAYLLLLYDNIIQVSFDQGIYEPWSCESREKKTDCDFFGL